MEIVDDGTLACLNIPRNENSRSFNCDEITQSKLVNRTFWVVDYLEDVPTKFSRAKGTKGQTLMRKSIKKNMCRKAARLEKAKKPLADKEFKRAMSPWLGWAKHSDSRNLIKKVITNKRKDLGL